MRKKIIYVDFVFKHKKVSYFKYYILYLFSSLLKKFKSFSNSKDKTFVYDERTKMLK